MKPELISSVVVSEAQSKQGDLFSDLKYFSVSASVCDGVSRWPPPVLDCGQTAAGQENIQHQSHPRTQPLPPSQTQSD